MPALRTAAAALVLLLIATAPAGAKTHKNANFKGHWVPANGLLEWTIKTENRKTGHCTGTTARAGYVLTACRVTGHAYTFEVHYGRYTSFNTGSFHHGQLSGQFHDTNGSKASYTATRT